MKIIGFDLSSRVGSLAVYSDGRVLTRTEWPNDRRNSAPFFRALDEALRKNSRPELIVVGLGPGSYTGTRIAISAAVGLQVACGAQLRGVPSVCAMSAENRFAVVGDAKRASFFLAHVQDGNLAGEIELLPEQQIRQRVSEAAVPFYSADDLPSLGTLRRAFPRAELLSELAHCRPENLACPPLEPIYLRAPHITVPRAAMTR
ncbi:MAG: tRNA (adenosine(37)-N6)-threonylcarbamoyltransferase complex dimerization subunit type 1 TsaB [Verrucomicrobia bacterium]|nr:tRNA (adenosine(37)-N6)-threonylcarbamoyltransferase complex dimerization subunit type 1 TsaB [Verrucomicrobiota bacterium]